MINEPKPFIADVPDGAFADVAPPVLSRYKEDYRRSTRDGQNIYAMIDAPQLYITPDEYKALTNKAEPEDAKQPFLKRGKVLSKAEAQEFYEPVIVALPQCGEYLDKFLWNSCPNLDERPIWSDLTEIEASAIARILLKRAQIDPAAATVVRAIVDGADYVTAMVAIGSRSIATAKAWRGRPISERKEKFSFIRKRAG